MWINIPNFEGLDVIRCRSSPDLMTSLAAFGNLWIRAASTQMEIDIRGPSRNISWPRPESTGETGELFTEMGGGKESRVWVQGTRQYAETVKIQQGTRVTSCQYVLLQGKHIYICMYMLCICVYVCVFMCAVGIIDLCECNVGFDQTNICSCRQNQTGSLPMEPRQESTHQSLFSHS